MTKTLSKCHDCVEGNPCYGDNYGCECECVNQKRPKCSEGNLLERNDDIMENIKKLGQNRQSRTDLGDIENDCSAGYLNAIDDVLALFKKSKE